jgi:hypothetical protein
LGQILEGFRLENVEIFYGRLEYFEDIWEIFGLFGTGCVDLVHFFVFFVSRTNKNLATLDFDLVAFLQANPSQGKFSI